MNNFNFLETTNEIEEKYTQIEFFKDKSNFKNFGDFWFVQFYADIYINNNVVREMLDKYLLSSINVDFKQLTKKEYFKSLDEKTIERLYIIFIINYDFIKNITEEELKLASLDDFEIIEKANKEHEKHYTKNFRIIKKNLTDKDFEDFNKKYSKKALRRNFKKIQRKIVVQLSSIFGLVNSHNKYCSKKTLELFNQQKARNNKFIENTVLVSNDKKQTINLKDIVRKPEHEFAEKLAIMNCYEKMAEEDGFTWSFITMTLEGEYHPNPTKGSNNWNGIPVYESVKILHKKWARIRTNLHDDDIKIFGVKVAEVHQDGCFHLHALVFHDANKFNEITKIVKNHFNSNENQAKIELSNGSASASSYCFKYIQKTLSSDVEEKAKNEKEFYTTMKNQAMRQACSVRALSFFGLKKGLITKWRTFARNYKKEKSLSDNVILSNIITTNDLYSFQKIADSIVLETESMKSSTGSIYKKILGFTYNGIKVLRTLFCMKLKEKDNGNSTIKKNYPREQQNQTSFNDFFEEIMLKSKLDSSSNEILT